MQSMNCPITAMQINLGEINGREQYIHNFANQKEIVLPLINKSILTSLEVGNKLTKL
jgi:hypothetical protein